jgi:aminomethyltransferase
MTSTELQRTPLNAEHRRLSARLVDFGGWEMPLHYGSQIEEHHHVRRDAGIFDVSHMLIVDVDGASAQDFLRVLLANDVARLRVPGKALYSCMLADDGGVLDDLVVYLLAPGRFRVVVNAATAAKDLTWINACAARFANPPEIRPRRDLAMIAIQGPRARELFWKAQPGARATTEHLTTFQAAELVGGLLVARTGYTGEDGFEVMLPAEVVCATWKALLEVGVAPCGLGARDTLRLEAGMNLYGQDMDESVTPLESGLQWTVDFSPGREFIGRRSLTSRTPRAKLAGIVLNDKGVLRSHQPVRTAHGEGTTTSGSFAPTLALSIALARVPVETSVGDRVDVQVREKWLSASVVKYPFVRHGRSLLPTNDPPGDSTAPHSA